MDSRFWQISSLVFLSIYFTVFAPDAWVNYIYTIYGLTAGVVYLLVALSFLKLRLLIRNGNVRINCGFRGFWYCVYHFLCVRYLCDNYNDGSECMDCSDCLYRTRNSVLGLRKSNAEKRSGELERSNHKSGYRKTEIKCGYMCCFRE